MKRAEHIDIFVAEMWAWYSHHKRTLPWRDLAVKDDTQRAYLVLVSEVMLQQTQVPRVIVSYKNFVQRFPHVKELSEASNSDVIRQWKGMGYNNRAIRLRDAARAIVDRHSGVFPQSMDDIIALPGIGHYTAAAIRNFAFGIPTPCLDTNIRRVLHRTFVGAENSDGTWKKDDEYLLRLAGEVLAVAIASKEGRQGNQGRQRLQGKQDSSSSLISLSSLKSAADWHAALMDFGSLVCTKRSPKWDICPLTNRGVMLASYKVKVRTKKLIKKEPGREIAGKFVPNRIIRGRVVDALRDHPKLSADQIGKRVCIDWTMGDHRDWLAGIIAGLMRDGVLADVGRSYALKE